MSAKILYIEDNSKNFYLVHYLLCARGHEVLWARDGQEGVDTAVAAKPELILLDIQLPVMDGYAVARALRQRPALAGIPIIAVTSYAMAGDRQKALEAGCTGYIEKPIDPAAFPAQIEGFLRPDAPRRDEP